MREELIGFFKVLVGIAVPLAAYAAGLRAPRTDALWLWRQPSLLLRSLLAILLVVPVGAILLLLPLAISPVAKGGIVVSILAVGIGPIAALKRVQGTRPLYEIGLIVTLLLASIVFMPVAVAIVGAVFDRSIPLRAGPVAQVVFTRALLPLSLGLVTGRLWPQFSERVGRYAGWFINGVTLLLVVVAVALTWGRLVGLGPGAWLACALVSVMAIAVGHLLGGPERDTRPVLAGFSALRFPALALLLASVAPNGRALIPVVLAYVLTSSILVTVYGLALAARERRRAPAHKPVAPPPGVPVPG